MPSDQSSLKKHLSKLGHSGYDKAVSRRGIVALVSTKLISSARHFNVQTIKWETVMAAKRKSKLRWRSKKANHRKRPASGWTYPPDLPWLQPVMLEEDAVDLAEVAPAHGAESTMVREERACIFPPYRLE